MKDGLTITRSFEIDAGHRLQNHESACRNVHGHRYRFEVTVSAPELDSIGRIIDFSDLKRRVGRWLEEKLDHAFIFEVGDPIEVFLQAHEMKRYAVPWPPTIEHLSMHLFETAGLLLGPCGLRIEHVRGYETPTCWADVCR